MSSNKHFYRVCRPETKQGLWYDQEGNFTGLIHDELDFCSNSELRMDFDPELVGWLSAVDSLDKLWEWFTPEDVKELQDNNFYIHVYEVTDHKFYERFQHDIINQETSKLIMKIELL